MCEKKNYANAPASAKPDREYPAFRLRIMNQCKI